MFSISYDEDPAVALAKADTSCDFYRPLPACVLHAKEGHHLLEELDESVIALISASGHSVMSSILYGFEIPANAVPGYSVRVVFAGQEEFRILEQLYPLVPNTPRHYPRDLFVWVYAVFSPPVGSACLDKFDFLAYILESNELIEAVIAMGFEPKSGYPLGQAYFH